MSLLIVVIDFIYLLYTLNSIKGDMSDKLKGNPFGGMAEAMMSTVQIQYGWVFLFIGSLLLVYAAFAKNITKHTFEIILIFGSLNKNTITSNYKIGSRRLFFS